MVPNAGRWLTGIAASMLAMACGGAGEPVSVAKAKTAACPYPAGLEARVERHGNVYRVTASSAAVKLAARGAGVRERERLAQNDLRVELVTEGTMDGFSLTLSGEGCETWTDEVTITWSTIRDGETKSVAFAPTRIP